jgi:hypothetical protein
MMKVTKQFENFGTYSWTDYTEVVFHNIYSLIGTLLVGFFTAHVVHYVSHATFGNVGGWIFGGVISLVVDFAILYWYLRAMRPRSPDQQAIAMWAFYVSFFVSTITSSLSGVLLMLDSQSGQALLAYLSGTALEMSTYDIVSGLLQGLLNILLAMAGQAFVGLNLRYFWVDPENVADRQRTAGMMAKMEVILDLHNSFEEAVVYDEAVAEFIAQKEAEWRKTHNRESMPDWLRDQYIRRISREYRQTVLHEGEVQSAKVVNQAVLPAITDESVPPARTAWTLGDDEEDFPPDPQ